MRLLFGLILTFFLPGVAAAFWQLAMRLGGRQSLIVPIGVGFIAGSLLERFLDRRFRRVSVFEHELTHAVAALLFFRPVHEFSVRHDGGYVKHGGGFGGDLANDFIGLAPYLLPTFSVVSVLARPLLGPAWFPWFDVWVGLTLGYHTVNAVRQTSWSWHKRRFFRPGTRDSTQSDIGSRGYAYSAVFISTLTLAIHGLLCAIVLRGYVGVPTWGRHVWIVTWGFVSRAAGRIWALASSSF